MQANWGAERRQAATNAEGSLHQMISGQNALKEIVDLEKRLKSGPRDEETAEQLAEEICSTIGRRKDTVGRFEAIGVPSDRNIQGFRREGHDSDDTSGNEHRGSEHWGADIHHNTPIASINSEDEDGTMSQDEEEENGMVARTATDVLNEQFADETKELRRYERPKEGEKKPKYVCQHIQVFGERRGPHIHISRNTAYRLLRTLHFIDEVMAKVETNDCHPDHPTIHIGYDEVLRWAGKQHGSVKNDRTLERKARKALENLEARRAHSLLTAEESQDLELLRWMVKGIEPPPATSATTKSKAATLSGKKLGVMCQGYGGA